MVALKNKICSICFIRKVVILYLVFILNNVNSRPIIQISGNYPKISDAYSVLFDYTCELSEQMIESVGFFGGYSSDSLLNFEGKICIKVEEKEEIEVSMKESGIYIDLEDPLLSAQFLWIFVRIKYSLFLLEVDCFNIWREVLIRLNLISSIDDLEYKNEYSLMIHSIPKIDFNKYQIRPFPSIDDFLLMISLATIFYKGGKFATDFTGKNIFLTSSLLKQRMTPLIFSNIEYYVPKLLKMYPPSLKYKDSIISTSLLYRLIYYCTGDVILPREAWEMWGLIMIWGGGGFIDEYKDVYEIGILTQNLEDNFPEERNFLTVIEKLATFQNPPWNVRFPPMHKNNEFFKSNPLFIFFNSKGYSLPNKNTKDNEGISVIYHIFHYFLNIFISIETSRDIWMVVKRWLNISREVNISNEIAFIQYDGYTTSKNIIVDEINTSELPRWASGADFIDVNSEIMLTHLEEFEYDFPFVVTCPNGNLVLKNNRKGANGERSVNRSQQIDLMAVKIAREVHTSFPTIKFDEICELASSLSLKAPIGIKLLSKYIPRLNSEIHKDVQGKVEVEFQDDILGIEYCMKGILNLILDSEIMPRMYEEPESLVKKDYLESACRRILKSPVKCSLEFPFYFPFEISNFFNTFAGNIANAMSSTFIGETHFYNQVIGTIWDGKIQPIYMEKEYPSFYRLHNPKFNPEGLCSFVEGFVNPAIINYFQVKTQENINNKKISERGKQKITDKIREKYFTKRKGDENKLFGADLSSLKKTINVHRIPRGALMSEWKKFLIDENTISSFITRIFKKPRDFEKSCRRRLESFLREGNLQFHPVIVDYNFYNKFLINRKERSNIFFKKVVRDDSVDPTLRELVNFLIFKHDSPEFIPEKFVKRLEYDVIFRRADLQFKNMINWYINDSCEKAYRLISKNIKEDTKSNCCKFFSCFNFMYNKPKPNIEVYSEIKEDYIVAEKDAVEEALEYGIISLLGDHGIDLRSSNIKFRSYLGVVKPSKIEPFTDTLNKNFIIINATFLYMHFLKRSVPINKVYAMRAAKIASILLKNYYFDGENTNDDNFQYLSKNTEDYELVGNLSFYERVTSKEVGSEYITDLCDLPDLNEGVFKMLEFLARYGNSVALYNDVLGWEANYLPSRIACEILLLLNNKLDLRQTENNYPIAYNIECLKSIAHELKFIPHIPIPICTSQKVLLECEENNAIYNLFATTIMKNLKFFGHDLIELEQRSCEFSKLLQMYHSLPDFYANCLNLFDKVFYSKVIQKEGRLLVDDIYLTSVRICNELDFSYSCDNISHPKLKRDADKIGNTIIFEITNEMSDYSLYWVKNAECDLAENIARSDIWNCFTEVQGLLKKYSYYQFPENFEKTICIKSNIWPRRCESETFENHSIFSTYLYDKIITQTQNKSVANNIYFTDICEILEKNYNKNRGNKHGMADTLLNPTEICEEIYNNSSNIIDSDPEVANENLMAKNKCIDLIRTDLHKVANDQLNLEFFDQNNDQILDPGIFLPSYMVNEFTDLLVNSYKLPPRVTIMSIALSMGLNKVNFIQVDREYISSKLAIIYISLKMVLFNGSESIDEMINNCVIISSTRIMPTPTDKDGIEICKITLSIYNNKRLIEDIYLLYSINNKVSSYYATPFISQNIEMVSKDYILKVLRGKPSQNIQRVYEQVLNAYTDYVLETGFVSHHKEVDTDGTEITMCNFSKQSNIRISREKNDQDFEDEDNLDKLLRYQTYEIELDNNPKSKMLKAIQMFNFILELKRIGAFQIHHSDAPSLLINDIRLDSLLLYLPPDIANWLTTFENLEFVKHFFIVPIDYKSDFGPLGKIDQDNDKLIGVMEQEGIFINKIRYSRLNVQTFMSAKKKQISPLILSSTIYYIITKIEKTINFGFSVSLNPYLFRNSIKKLTKSEDLLEKVNNYYRKGSLVFSKKQHTAIEAIGYFIDSNVSSLRSKISFHWNKIESYGDLHKDSLYNFDGKLHFNEMNAARRIFCNLVTKQLLHGADTGDNPFFTCKMFRFNNNEYEEVNTHTEGKTFRICLFTGRATKAKKTGKEETDRLTHEYLNFLLHGNKHYIPFVSDSIRISPELILRAIGRIYGHCLLFEEPMNLNFHNFIFKHLTDGDAYFEDDIRHYLEPRISKFQKVISTSFKDLDIKKFPTARINFENSRKRVFGQEPIYYYIDSEEYDAYNSHGRRAKQSNELLKVTNFNNLRFLKRNITKFILHDKFEVELNSFIAGVSDIIPIRFLRGFKQPNIYYYVQGYISTHLRSDLIIKKSLPNFFYVEDSELLLPHKSKLFNYFIMAIVSLSYIDIGYFFSIFFNRFTIMPPTAYIGRIRVVEAPIDKERNPHNRIIVNPLQLVVYVPFYNSYLEYEENVANLVGNQKKILNPIIK